MRLFDVLGPVMIGPSSSHTAGAARIGYTAQKLLGDVPAEADIGLYGSFATTGRGHGTDRALVAGLLGLRPDDPRLPDSFALAEEAGMKFTIHPVELRAAHPNTTVLTLKSKAGRTLVLKAASVGGGRIRVTEIDGVPADFGGDSNTLIIHNEDTPGCIAEVTMSLAQRRINIASMQVFRAATGGYAVMVLECDSHIPPRAGTADGRDAGHPQSYLPEHRRAGRMRGGLRSVVFDPVKRCWPLPAARIFPFRRPSSAAI